jgi:hypothetical protein
MMKSQFYLSFALRLDSVTQGTPECALGHIGKRKKEGIGELETEH